MLSVCKFIQYQAMKDRPQHNKDLHTSIVAALRTLLMWINAHPYLLGNKVSIALYGFSYRGWTCGPPRIRYVTLLFNVKSACTLHVIHVHEVHFDLVNLSY